MTKVYFFEIPNNFDKSITPSTMGKQIVNTVAKLDLNIDNSQIIIDRTETGKPFLKDFSNFNFNISHCKNAVAVAFSDYPVGIDIEKINECKHKVAKRYFSTAENEYINQSADINCAFYEIWTKKEAYLKCKGTGIGASFSKLCVFDNEIKNHLHTLSQNDYIISICCNDINNLEFNILNNDFFDNM